jgi:hypothetical protein
MASLNKTVRETAAKMSAPAKPKGPASRVSVERVKGGYVAETHHGEAAMHYYPPVKSVHKNLRSVKSHMAHAFNDADADEV